MQCQSFMHSVHIQIQEPIKAQFISIFILLNSIVFWNLIIKPIHENITEVLMAEELKLAHGKAENWAILAITFGKNIKVLLV